MERAHDYVKQRIGELVRELQDKMQPLRQKITLLTEEYDKLDLEVQRLQNYFSLDISSHTSSGSVLPSVISVVSHTSPQIDEKREATQLMANVLARAGSPLSCQVILERLKTEENFDMPGKDPLANLASRLRGSTRFVQVVKGIYALRGQRSQKSAKSVARKKPLAEHARQAFEETQRPMRLGEIRDCLKQKGLMQGSWSHQGLRIVLKNHDYFESLAPGVFALKEWPPEQKTIPVTLALASLGSQETGTHGIQPLTTRICQLLEDVHRPMKREELGDELVRQGKATRKEVVSSVSSALSRLLNQHRIQRLEPGIYTSMSYQGETRDQNGAIKQQATLFSGSESEKLANFDV